MKEPAVLLETKLPRGDDFYNDLDCVHITQERYAFTQKVWRVFKCKNLMDYLHVYLLADCLLWLMFLRITEIAAFKITD